jgi:hypothetical protein
MQTCEYCRKRFYRPPTVRKYSEDKSNFGLPYKPRILCNTCFGLAKKYISDARAKERQVELAYTDRMSGFTDTGVKP